MTSAEETMSRLEAAIRKLGHKVVGGTVDGEVSIYVERDHARGYSQRPGRLRIKYGTTLLGFRKFQAPEPKEGFDFEKIAGAICKFAKECTHRREEQRKTENTREATNKLARTISAEFPKMYDAEARANKYGDLTVVIDMKCTPEQARRLLAVAASVSAENDKSED